MERAKTNLESDKKEIERAEHFAHILEILIHTVTFYWIIRIVRGTPIQVSQGTRAQQNTVWETLVYTKPWIIYHSLEKSIPNNNILAQL